MNKKQRILAELRQIGEALRFPVIAVALGLAVGGVIIWLSGSNPFKTLAGLASGGFGSSNALTTTLTRATPIIFAGLAASLAWGSGYSSMGASGQMVLGAFAAAVFGAALPGPPFWTVLAALLAGMLTGTLYSLFSAYISAKFDAYLLVVTLMFNYVADNAASYLTTYTFRDPLATDRLAVQTQKITDAILPRILPQYTVHYGFVLAVFFVGLMLFIMKRTSFGYKAKMGGLNAHFAEYGGVNSLKTMYTTLALSGAVAGLGGAVEVLGTRFRYIDKMITSPGYAWSGIIASLMSANHPVGVLISSVFLSGLTTGGGTIELRMSIPSEITIIIQGVLTMFVTAKPILDWRAGKKRRNSKKEERHATGV
jgi:simple sugar transport system permease protein